MAHYKNGREAKVGDPVVGTSYNDGAFRAGTLVAVQPEQAVCNAEVEYVHTLPLAAVQSGLAPRMHALRVPAWSTKEGEQVHFLCRDATETGHLLHADDLVQAPAAEAPAAAVEALLDTEPAGTPPRRKK
jgi:hypothetical protein